MKPSQKCRLNLFILHPVYGKVHSKVTLRGTEETAQQLGALAVLAEEPGLMPSTHMVANKSITPVPEYPTPSSDL